MIDIEKTLDGLPESVKEIALVIGRDDALILIAASPKMRDKIHGERASLYVPQLVTDDHWITKSIGRTAATKLADAFGGECLYPANCKDLVKQCRDGFIFHEVSSGKSTAEISEKSGVSSRQVRNIAKAEAEKTGWGNLKLPTGRRKGK